MRFHRGRRDGLCSSQEGVGGGAERKHTKDASSNVGGVEGTCRRGTRRARATRGGQLRRRASGDRALKGPTPHAPSSCQLSFFLSSSPSSSFSRALSLSFPFSTARMRLSSFSLPLSPHVTSFFSYSPTFLHFRFSYLDELRRTTSFLDFHRFPRLILPFPVISFLPRSSSSFPFRRRGRRRSASTYRHARPSRSEPRRRVSRFKLTRQRAL